MFLFLLFLMPLISSIEFSMKSNFSQEETLIAKLSGDFTKSILKQDISLYRKHVRVGIDAEVAKIDNDYYIYAHLSGKSPGNYSLIIKDAEYKKGSREIKEDLIKNFTISEEYADFYVFPGFVSTKDNFKLTLNNLYDNELNIKLNVTPIYGNAELNYEDEEEYEIVLKSGTNELDFELISLDQASVKKIYLMSENVTYEIPISFFIDEQSSHSKVYDFDIAPFEIEFTMSTNSNATKLIYIYNTGTGTLEDVRLELINLAPFVTLSEDRFGQIISDSNANTELKIVSGSQDKLQGKLKVTANNIEKEIPILINLKKGYKGEIEQDIATTKNCEDEEIGGKICSENEICSGQEIYSQNGLCCIGECNAQVSGSYLKYLGYLILIAVILFVGWFFLKKYKNVKTPLDLLKIAKGEKL